MLHSTSDLAGRAVEAADGRVVLVGDLLFDDRTWKVLAFVLEDDSDGGLALPVASHNDDHSHLRSCNELVSFAVACRDAEAGKVSGCIVEMSGRTIRYLIVEITGLMTSRRVLLPIQAIDRIDWAMATVHVGVRSQLLHNADEYNERSDKTREYEARLHKHYGLPNYWQ